MKKNKSKFKFFNLLRIWPHLTNNMRKRFFLLLLSMIANTFFEMLTIASIIPFLTIISEPEKIWEIPFSTVFTNFLNIQNTDQFILPFILLFILIIVSSGLTRLFNLWYSCRYSAIIGEKITVKAFNNFLNLPYEKHLELNTSEVISTISRYSDYLVIEIYEYLRMITATLLSIGLIASFIIVDWKLALITIVIFISSYLLMFILSKKNLSKIQNVISESNIKQISLMQESAGSIRDIILDKNQNLIGNIFRLEKKRYLKAVSNLTFLQSSPRIYIEVFALLILAILSIFIINNQKSSINSITLIGVIALTGQKLLPLLQQIYAAVLSCNSTKLAVSRVLDFLESNNQIYLNNEDIPLERFTFKKEIVLKNASFKYKYSKKYVFRDVNLTFHKGERIGIVGKTGSGKSTLIDMLMGLLNPTKGNLVVDGINLRDKRNYKYLQKWRLNISHVPQEVFLLNNSFYKNIGLSSYEKELNIERVKKAADIAKISSFIEKQPFSYDTIISEKGNNLSGGQKQRIGIARSLYKNSDILFLDEATSALDKGTEKSILNSINLLPESLTIFIVTHRKETLKYCDRILEIKDNKILEVDK